MKRIGTKILTAALGVSLFGGLILGPGVEHIHASSDISVNDFDDFGELESVKIPVDISEIGVSKVRMDFELDIDTLEETNVEPVEETNPTYEVAEEVIEEVVELTIEERIRIACEHYNIPYDIVIAIARLETGWFTSHAYIYGNNPGGLSVNEQPICFSTIEEGVERFVSNLANNYFYIGLTTPESIGGKYCPVNPDWAYLVRGVMASA